MDVDTNIDRVVPTENIVNVLNQNLPSLLQKMEIDSSIDHQKTTYIYPEPSDIASGGPINFMIHSTPQYYLDMANIYVEFKITLLNSLKTRVGEGDWKSYFINNLSQSLWSTVKVSLNNTNVESSYHVQQLSNLHHILTTPNLTVENRGKPHAAFPIIPDSIKQTIDAGMIAQEDIVKRIEFSKTVNGVNIIAPLALDIASATKYLMDGVDMKLTLEPSQANYIIKRTNSAGNTQINHKYKIENVRLKVKLIKPSDGVYMEEQKSLLKRPFEYLLRRQLVKEIVFPQNQREITISRPYQSIIPNKIYLFMVDQRAAHGSYYHHPFFYGDFGLQSYSVKIDGLEIAGHTVSNDLVETYVNSVRAHSEDYFIPYDLYKKGCFVIAIDTNQGSELNTLAIERRGNMSISLHMSEPLENSLLVYVVGVVDSAFTLDSNRSINTIYQF